MLGTKPPNSLMAVRDLAYRVNAKQVYTGSSATLDFYSDISSFFYTRHFEIALALENTYGEGG